MKRALHNLSHERLSSFNCGELVPMTCYEGLPNDTIRGNTNMLVRTQPLLAPVMHKLRVDIFHYFVPMRLIWDDWENFRTGGADGEQEPVIPYVTSPVSTGFLIGSLADHLGAIPGVPSLAWSALPFRAYNRIWNDFFRDKDLQTERVVSTASGSDTTTDLTLASGCWEKDYFTSARPEPQLGDAVSIPLTGNAPVVRVSNAAQPVLIKQLGSNVSSGAQTVVSSGGGAVAGGTDGTGKTFDPNGSLVADMAGISAVNIEDLRFASAVERFKEWTARYGHTLSEYYRGFGVAPADSRMQWPEFIAGGSQIIQFSEVLQTAEGAEAPVGELRGHGISAGRSNRFKYHCTEDGLFITLCIARPNTVYMQASSKMWLRPTKYDYYVPQLEGLGSQEILNREVSAGHSSPNSVFGYQDRYDEYRRIQNSVAGEFRDTLDFWHMARDFSDSPNVALNSSFVTANPTDRIYATDADQLQVRAMHSVKAKRLVSKRSKPRLS